MDDRDYRQSTEEEEYYQMSEPSIADERYNYFMAEVRARYGTGAELYRMASHVIKQQIEDAKDIKHNATLDMMVDCYLEHTREEDLIGIVADALARGDIDYDHDD